MTHSNPGEEEDDGPDHEIDFEEPQPSTSKAGHEKGKSSRKAQQPLSTDVIRKCMDEQHRREKLEAKCHMEQLVKEAERSKAEIFRPTGKSAHIQEIYDPDWDDFFHIDSVMISKIEKGEYVDLHKLLPKRKSYMMKAKSKRLAKRVIPISCL